MMMTPSIRKFALTAHVTASVGWLGAVVGFLALALAVQAGYDPQLLRGLYLAMWLAGWYVVVPLCLASLLTGLVMSLGTKWGLFRHYWVTVKFLLTVISTLILLGFTQTLGYIGVLAADASGPVAEFSQSPLTHSAGGLVVLLINTALSIYKPWGKTPFARDTPGEEIGEVSPDRPLIAKIWLRFTVLGLISLLLLFLIVHLMTRGGH